MSDNNVFAGLQSSSDGGFPPRIITQSPWWPLFLQWCKDQGLDEMAKSVEAILNQAGPYLDQWGQPRLGKSCKNAADCARSIQQLLAGNQLDKAQLEAFKMLATDMAAAASKAGDTIGTVYRYAQELAVLWPAVKNASPELFRDMRFCLSGQGDSRKNFWFNLEISIPVDFWSLIRGISPLRHLSTERVSAGMTGSLGASTGLLVDAAFNALNSNGGYGSIEGAASLFSCARQAIDPPRRDPLVLDLNKDEILTTPPLLGMHFDHLGDGFSELSGWIDWNDGLLAMDKNGNGIIDDDKELFSNHVLSKYGVRATNGFQALAELDENGDGRIDAQDQAYSQLKVWKRSAEEGKELTGLAELGIKSISVRSTADYRVDDAGNTRTRSGSFELMDGSTAPIAEYNFRTYSLYTIPKETLPVPYDIAAMPDIRGFGNVYDLHQAMVRDTSGYLKSLLEQFVEAGDPDLRNKLTRKILQEWTGNADEMELARIARYRNFDEATLRILETFFGERYDDRAIFPAGNPATPVTGMASAEETDTGFMTRSSSSTEQSGPPSLPPGAVMYLRESYRLLFERVYAHLMAQTQLADLYGRIVFTMNDYTQQIQGDMTGLIDALKQELVENPERGRLLLGEFARTYRGSGADRVHCLACREIFLQIDPTLDWVIDTGGLPVYDRLGQGDGWWLPHMWGTDGADAVKGSPTEGDGYINGMNGDDVIYGTDRDEVLYNETGDALFVAGGGKDTIYAGADNDILDGGAGADTLYGEAGNDTYIFRRGSGQDTVIDYDAVPDNLDTIFLGGDLTPDDITLKRAGNNLVLKINNEDDTLTVKDFFRNDGILNRVERILFMDGTIWDDTEMIRRAYAPTDGADTLYGGSGNDELRGLGGSDALFGMAGNDTLRGDAGADTLVGGAGDDTLIGGGDDDRLDGGSGADTYVLMRGAGHDTVVAQAVGAGSSDTLALGEGILSSDIRVERIGSDLQVTISDTGDSITFRNSFQNDALVSGVQRIIFADGTAWDAEAIRHATVQGTEGADVMYGFSGSDSMHGFGGDDTLYARAGDDTLEGGDGHDTLVGGSGADLLAGEAGEDICMFSRRLFEVFSHPGNLCMLS